MSNQNTYEVVFKGNNADLLAKIQASKVSLKDLAQLGNAANLPDYAGYTFSERNLKKDLQAQKDILAAVKGISLEKSKVAELKTPATPQNVNPFSSFFGKGVFKGLGDEIKQSGGLDKYWSDAVKRGTLSGLKQSVSESTQASDWWGKAVMRGNVAAFKQSLKAPPVIEKEKGFLEKMSHGFGGASVRNLTSALGGSAGLASALGGVAGVFTALGVVGWAVKQAFDLLAPAIHKVIEAFNTGEKLFIKSSQLGRNAGQLASSRFAGNAIGLSDEEQDRYALQTSMGTGGKGNLGRMDVITKMIAPSLIKPFEDAQKWAETTLTPEWKRIVGELFTTKKMSERVSAQMELFWAEIAAKLGPSLRSAFKIFADMPWAEWGKSVGDLLLPLKIFFDQLAGLADLANKLGTLKVAPGSALWVMGKIGDAYDSLKESPYEQHDLRPPTGIALPQMGQWEKLGLTFGAGGSNDYARTTADSTKKSASLLEVIVQAIANGASSLGAASANVP